MFSEIIYPFRKQEFVYSMGRCGSTMLEDLTQSFHIHNLYSGGILMSGRTTLRPSSLKRKLYNIALRNYIFVNAETIYVPLRNPRDRLVSIFFQMLPMHMYSYLHSASEKALIRSTQMSGNELLFRAMLYSNQIQFPDLWMDRELGKLKKIDWRSIKLNQDTLIHSERFGLKGNIVIFRIEDFDEIYSKNSELFQLKKPLLKPKSREKNASINKWYFPLYKDFLNSAYFEKARQAAQESDVYRTFYAPRKLL